jgi:UDP-3-O-[3-hydroxymyristoyl] glucosamine N-acyltransferase
MTALSFERSCDLSLADVAKLAGVSELPAAAANKRIFGIAALDQAGPRDLVFCDNAKFLHQLATTQACACLLLARFADAVPPNVVLLVTQKPYPSFVAVSRALFPESLRPSSLFADAKRQGAHIDPAARLEADVHVDPGAVIGARAEVGSGTVLGAGAVIGPGVRIGRNCRIGSNASITHALIGDRVIIHPGCRIGQDGFGFLREEKRYTKVPQLGRVIIQDDVEVGANSTIDRGGIRDTVIGEGTKIDNLVQVGHNTVVGRHCIVVSQTGISGSVIIGDGAVLGGQVGIADHVTIGPGAMLAAKTGVMHDVAAGARIAGYPARTSQQWLRETLILERLAKGRSMKSRRADDQTEK